MLFNFVLIRFSEEFSVIKMLEIEILEATIIGSGKFQASLQKQKSRATEVACSYVPWEQYSKTINFAGGSDDI